MTGAPRWPRRYELPPPEMLSTSGWAIIVIDADRGFFSAVSDYGNYAYNWFHPGCEFRQFLVNCDLDYIYSKLTPARVVFDCEASVAYVRKAILRRRRAGEISAAHARAEWDDLSDVYTEGGFQSWLDRTSFDDPYEAAGEYWRTKKEPQCWAFCENIFPRFQNLLRVELEKEKQDAALETPSTVG